MHQQEITVFTQRGTVCRACQRCNYSVSPGFVIFLVRVSRQFIKSRGNDSSCRCIAVCIRYARCIKIPVWDAVFGIIGVIGDEIQCLFRLIQILLIPRLPVAKDESVNAPGLSACPGTFICITLVGVSVSDTSVTFCCNRLHARYCNQVGNGSLWYCRHE